jgi:hypothetical protein
MTKTDYDPDRSLVLIEGLSHFLTNFLENLASCQTSLILIFILAFKFWNKRFPSLSVTDFPAACTVNFKIIEYT